MDLINMTIKERFAMMRKRHAFLAETVKGYTSLEEYAKDKDEWFAGLGIQLSLEENSLSLTYTLIDYSDYETYHIVPTHDGCLAVSHLIWWQNEICANEVLNIFTEKTAEENEILKVY